MFFKQYYLGCLAHASYLIGDIEEGRAAVVDPQRDIDEYLRDAREAGLEITDVLLTHFHADFVAGHLGLRAATGAKIHIGSRGDTEFESVASRDGAVLAFGSIRLTTLETPGHTPESVCYLLHDLSEDTETPRAIFTGDTLFIGDVGRPDLLASIGFTDRELGAMLYESLTRKILPLPDEILVYPAHGAGSLCGKNLSEQTSGRLGDQKQFNYALQPMSEEEFIDLVTADQPAAPAYFVHDAMVNRQQHATLAESLEQSLRPLSLDEVRVLHENGAYLLDVRDPDDYAKRFLEGTYNIGLGGSYATWSGTMLGKHRDIVIIADSGREREAAVRLGRIGFDQVVGYLEGGMSGIPDSAGLQSYPRVAAHDLSKEMGSGSPPYVVDIRAPGERAQIWIAGTVHLPLNELEARIDEIPRDRDIVIQCAGGYRSSIAGSLLRIHGIDRVTDLIEGLRGWHAAGLPIRHKEAVEA